MNRESMNHVQKDMWDYLTELYYDDLEVELNMPAWADFLKDVTAYDGVIQCQWKGLAVSVDNEVPYVMEPHPDFPVAQEGYKCTLYGAWKPEWQPPPEYLVEPESAHGFEPGD